MNAAIFPPIPGVIVIPPIMLLLLLLFILPLLFVFILLVAVGVAYIIPVSVLLFMAFCLFMLWFALFAGVPCIAVSPHATSKTVSSNIIPISPELRRAFMDSYLLQCQVTYYIRCKHHLYKRRQSCTETLTSLCKLTK